MAIDAGTRKSAPYAIVALGVEKRFLVPHERMQTLKERALHPVRGRRKDSFAALSGIDLAVRTGEFFGLVGRNGSGKSTLLKCLAGIYRPNAGSIHVNGRLSTFIELGVGFNPELAAYDNVILNATLLGLSRAEASRRYERIMDFAELWEFENLKLKNYSSGMNVRLAFSAMIQVDADVLLIDEVLAVGDAAFQQKCFDQFHRLRDEGRTIVFVSHDMSAVEQFCDRAMLLEHGEVIAVDRPREVGRRYMELNFDPERAMERDAATPEESGVRLLGAQFLAADGRAVGTAPVGTEVEFVVEIEFQVEVENPWAAFAVTNEYGHLLLAAGSAEHLAHSGVYRPGNRAELRLKMPLQFAAGRISVTVDVGPDGSPLRLLRAESAGSLVVTGGRRSGAVVELPHQVSFTLANEERVSR